MQNYFCSIMIFKTFVVFKILEVKNLRFWPLKILDTLHVTFIIVWLDQDYWDKYFLFYDLYQNDNSLGEIIGFFWAPYSFICFRDKSLLSVIWYDSPIVEQLICLRLKILAIWNIIFVLCTYILVRNNKPFWDWNFGKLELCWILD